MNITELDKFKLEDAVKFHDELNPRLFDGSKLRPVIKHQLQEIAKDFIEFMGIPTLAIEDVIITGSNVAYTYTPHSDIDLHLLVDFSKLPDNEVYQELFKAKKTLYNNTYDITVRDIPVELYVQDTAQPHVSLGEYSLVQDKLTRIPTKKRANFDQASAAAKFERLEELCIEALKSDSLQKVEKVLDIIKRYRQAGLDKHGEFGPENLAFKAIRSKGYFQKLHDHKNYLKSEELSIEEMRKRKQFEESIGIQKILDKPTPTVEELAQKYNVSRQKVLQQLDKGIKIEKEHTSDREAAKQIALDHLGEKLEYYELLAKFDESLMRYPQKFDQYGMPDYELYLSLIDRLVKKGHARKDIINFLMTKFDDIDTRDARDLLIRYQITHPSQAWIKEGASGYIPSEAEKDDPRFKMALTVDIKPDTMQKNAKKLGWKIQRDGRPPLLRK